MIRVVGVDQRRFFEHPLACLGVDHYRNASLAARRDNPVIPGPASSPDPYCGNLEVHRPEVPHDEIVFIFPAVSDPSKVIGCLRHVGERNIPGIVYCTGCCIIRRRCSGAPGASDEANQEKCEAKRGPVLKGHGLFQFERFFVSTRLTGECPFHSTIWKIPARRKSFVVYGAPELPVDMRWDTSVPRGGQSALAAYNIDGRRPSCYVLLMKSALLPVALKILGVWGGGACGLHCSFFQLTVVVCCTK